MVNYSGGQVYFVGDDYSVADAYEDWEREKEVALNNLLNSVDVSDFAVENAQNELNEITKDIPWKDAQGYIANNKNLKYVKNHFDGSRGYYMLEDNSIVVQSSSEQRLTKTGDLRDKYNEYNPNDKFYYIKLAGSHEWSEMLFYPENTVDELANLFRLAGLDLGKNLGRYVLPIEDIKILINGKDFAGQPTSRWLAAGMLLVEVVPGGKVFKIVGRSAIKGLTRWSKVIIWGGKEFVLKFEIINGLVHFGDRTQLARILKTASNIEAHHIIPWIKGGQHPVVQKAAKDGLFHLNMVENGLGLEKFTSLVGSGLHGNHPAYDTYVIRELDKFMNTYPNFDANNANHFIRNVLIPDLKNKITLAKNSGLNLNEFFKRFL